MLVAGSPPFLSRVLGLCFLLPSLTWGCLAGCESFEPWLLFVQGETNFLHLFYSISLPGMSKDQNKNHSQGQERHVGPGWRESIESLLVKGEKLGEGVSKQPGEMKSGLRTESVLGPSCPMHLWPFSAPRASLLGCLLGYTQGVFKPWMRSYQGHRILTKGHTNSRAVPICEQ